MRNPPIDPAFFTENRRRLMAEMKPGAIAVIHAADIMPRSADGVLPFYQSSDLFYLTGVNQEETTLVLWPHARDPADREMLFVRETSDLIQIWEGAKLTKEAARQVTGMENVQWTDRFETEFRRVMKRTSTVYLNANEHPRAAREVQTRDDRFRLHCQSLYPQHRLERLAPILHALRIIKADAEIEMIQKACNITDQGFQRILRMLRPGVMEYEVEAEFSHEFLRHGSRGFAYQPIIASGVNACVLHYLTNDACCEDGQLLLLDVAAEYGTYNSDLTRTIPVNGHYTARQRDVYNSVLRVFRACLDELLKPGVKIKDYQKQVGRVTELELIGLGLIDEKAVAEERAKDDDENECVKEEDRLYRKYFMHGTSHSMGLDVHDVGPADLEVADGMVFTIEPGIYVPEEGFGVRLENDVVVREDGNVDLMAHIPIESEEIEAIMAEGK